MNKLVAAIKVVILAFFIIPIFIVVVGPLWLVLDWWLREDVFVHSLRYLINKTQEALDYE